jgi:exonuclease SbcC
LLLALADKVQQQLKAEKNFFFIDEGFGTLDDEALESVFETLRSLSSENKIIGVISHVESSKTEY